jgi:DNA-binding response OmpR family regulator
MTGERGEVLIIEDSVEVSKLLVRVLEDEAFEAITCFSAAEGLAAFAASAPAAVILDWVLPDSSGVEVCRELRRRDELVTILFLSGRQDEVSIVRALDAGADDYLSKPFRARELIARLEAGLRKTAAARRSSGEAPAGVPPPSATLRQGEVEIDPAARQVRVAGETVILGPLEFQLLDYLFRNPGVAISRDQVLSTVYGYTADITTERVDVLFRRLRSKLGEGPGRGAMLVAVPGYGYRLDRRSADRG